MMRLLKATIGLAIIFAIGCQPKTSQQVIIDGNERSVFHVNEEGQRHGLYQRYLDGQLVEEAHYQSDTLHGARSLYRKDGSHEILERYEQGKFVGKYQTFHPNGKVELEGMYLDGSMEGIWKKFYPSGALEEEVTMSSNDENGPFKEYYEDGTLKAEGSYLNGDYEHGELKMYAADGSLERIMMCREGMCNTTWSADEE